MVPLSKINPVLPELVEGSFMVRQVQQLRMNGNVSTAECHPVDINLCAGAGGLALGLAQAGSALCEFYDKDRDACTTLNHNLRNAPFVAGGRVIQGDLTEVEWTTNCGQIRLLAAGAPCQPFSRGGSRRGHEDERNLFPTILEAVRALRPRAVMIENVRGLGGASQQAYLEYILNQLRYPELVPRENETWEDHSKRLEQHRTAQCTHPTYRVQSAVFNAADFGVPQMRYRMFIVATEVDLPEYKFPIPTHSKYRLRWEQATGAYWEKRGLRPRTKTGAHRKSSTSKRIYCRGSPLGTQ